MKASESLKSKLKAEEGFEPKQYKDGFIKGVQQYSIGHGHQIQPSEKDLKTATLTRAQASQLFEKDILIFENQVNQSSKRTLTQNQFDALVSFAYNAGPGAVIKVLNTWNVTGDSLATTDHMKLYNKWTKNGVLVVHEGLVSRRIRETKLFLSDIVIHVVASAKKKELS